MGIGFLFMSTEYGRSLFGTSINILIIYWLQLTHHIQFFKKFQRNNFYLTKLFFHSFVKKKVVVNETLQNFRIAIQNKKERTDFLKFIQRRKIFYLVVWSFHNFDVILSIFWMIKFEDLFFLLKLRELRELRNLFETIWRKPFSNNPMS